MPENNLKYKLVGSAILIIILALAIKLQISNQDYRVETEKLENITKLTITPKPGKFFVSNWWASSLPMQGQINENNLVVLTEPGIIYLINHESPMGVSFRENKCTGLLSHFQTFDPPLSPFCQNCRGESEYPEYNVCVAEHKTDPDFFLDIWHIYLGNDPKESNA